MGTSIFTAIAQPVLELPRSAPLRIVGALRQAILSGELEGGRQLKQEELASAFGVSRVPVREALRMLEAEGLVDFHPNRGAVVTAVTTEEVADIYTIRAALEVAAMELSVPQLSISDLDLAATILDEIDEQTDIDRLGELNRRFHLTLYSHCNRKKLLEEINSYLKQGDRLLRFHFSQSNSRSTASQDEHRAMLTHCRAGEFDKASTMLRSHILDAGSHLVALVAETSPAAANT